MKISELIAELEKNLEIHGDLNVVVCHMGQIGPDVVEDIDVKNCTYFKRLKRDIEIYKGEALIIE